MALRVLRAALLALVIAAPAAAIADESSDALLADAMRLLGARTYVASASNWCSLNIADDPDLTASVEAWTARNRPVNERAVQVIEAVGGLSPEQRAAMNRAGDQMIRKDIQSRPDPRAFCRALPEKLDSGIIDVEKRDDLRAPLQRVLAYPLPRS
jgi:hypothetical protein